MKADVKAVIRDYGIGSWTVVVSVIDAADGTPLTTLTEKNFSIVAVQSPSGWATNDVLKIKSGLNKPLDGIYIFAAGNTSNKKLASGPYTLAITLTGSKERGVPLNGQTVVEGRIA